MYGNLHASCLEAAPLALPAPPTGEAPEGSETAAGEGSETAAGEGSATAAGVGSATAGKGSATAGKGSATAGKGSATAAGEGSATADTGGSATAGEGSAIADTGGSGDLRREASSESLHELPLGPPAWEWPEDLCSDVEAEGFEEDCSSIS